MEPGQGDLVGGVQLEPGQRGVEPVPEEGEEPVDERGVEPGPVEPVKGLGQPVGHEH